jgi:hypothetical protein
LKTMYNVPFIDFYAVAFPAHFWPQILTLSNSRESCSISKMAPRGTYLGFWTKFISPRLTEMQQMPTSDVVPLQITLCNLICPQLNIVGKCYICLKSKKDKKFSKLLTGVGLKMIDHVSEMRVSGFCVFSPNGWLIILGNFHYIFNI